MADFLDLVRSEADRKATIEKSHRGAVVRPQEPVNVHPFARPVLDRMAQRLKAQERPALQPAKVVKGRQPTFQDLVMSRPRGYFSVRSADWRDSWNDDLSDIVDGFMDALSEM